MRGDVGQVWCSVVCCVVWCGVLWCGVLRGMVEEEEEEEEEEEGEGGGEGPPQVKSRYPNRIWPPQADAFRQASSGNQKTKYQSPSSCQ